MLLPNDLAIIVQLVARASIPVGEIGSVIPTLQRLDAAQKAGKVLVALDPETPDAQPANAGGTD